VTDGEQVMVVMYAWHVTGSRVVDLEEGLGLVKLSPGGIREARRLVKRDSEARALFERVCREEREKR